MSFYLSSKEEGEDDSKEGVSPSFPFFLTGRIPAQGYLFLFRLSHGYLLSLYHKVVSTRRIANDNDDDGELYIASRKHDKGRGRR